MITAENLRNIKKLKDVYSLNEHKDSILVELLIACERAALVGDHNFSVDLTSWLANKFHANHVFIPHKEEFQKLKEFLIFELNSLGFITKTPYHYLYIYWT